MAENNDKDARTEEATPKRRQEARDKGQVAMSTEFVAAIGLCAGLAILAWGSGDLMSAIGELIVVCVHALPVLGTQDLDQVQTAALIREAITKVGPPLALVALPAIGVSAAAGYLQAGFKFTPKALEPDINKFNPIKGFSRLFSMKSTVRTLLAGIKVLAIGAAMSTAAWMQVESIVTLGDNELGPLLAGMGQVAFRATTAALIVIVLLSIIDLLYQRWQHAKDQRMTKQEIKEEHRLADGDPHVKARIRKVQVELALKRMMNDLPEATVVVTNPTHYAVALKYERDEKGNALQAAPICVAKGVDYLAQRIKARAAEAKVICYEDVPLARALYAQVEIGDSIPEELYAAVAVVLGHVYRMQSQSQGQVPQPAVAV